MGLRLLQIECRPWKPGALSNGARRGRDDRRRRRRRPEATAAATAAAEATAAATAAAAEAAARALFLRTSLIDRELTAAEFRPVDLLSRDLGLIIGSHGHECEAARAARHLVHGNIYVGNGAELPEVRA